MMSDKKENQSPKAAAQPKPVLRLVSQEAPSSQPPELFEKPARPGLSNPLVQQMRAYADAIDQEIKAILEL